MVALVEGSALRLELVPKVGVTEGATLGPLEALPLGSSKELPEEAIEGERLGTSESPVDGSKLGTPEGPVDGSKLGTSEGKILGVGDDIFVGPAEGNLVG
jgi:hypothetical protein